ncbi:sigma-70 family RNA polymerase sigma factor [Corynebacterium aquilae]|uniref:sigma-70 family RNA polymerase sigma factor n=1 Tax=Corynebacterium aquilae TaxID=203263 RepID=UPI001472E370|nr:sigma-70 family RNA polymerase sigma factor [Corynebacterium aquilae]
MAVQGRVVGRGDGLRPGRGRSAARVGCGHVRPHEVGFDVGEVIARRWAERRQAAAAQTEAEAARVRSDVAEAAVAVGPVDGPLAGVGDGCGVPAAPVAACPDAAARGGADNAVGAAGPESGVGAAGAGAVTGKKRRETREELIERIKREWAVPEEDAAPPAVAPARVRGGTAPAARLHQVSKPQGAKDRDHELVRAYVAGDEAAFDVLVKKHEHRMKRVARKWANAEEDTEDIVQEALLNAARKLESFRFEAKVSTWLHRLVVNSAHSYYRQKSLETVSLDEEGGLGESVQRRYSYDPFDRWEDRFDVMLRLRHIPAQTLAVLYTVDMLGLPLRQAADELGMPRKELTKLRDQGRQAVAEGMDQPADEVADCVPYLHSVA